MIYDRNQFTFNIIFVILISCLLIISLINIKGYLGLRSEIILLNNQTLAIRDKVNGNYIQPSHSSVGYLLTDKGFFIEGADEFGTINGPSMQPSLFDGHTLFMERVGPNSTLLPGDIVRFVDSDSIAVIHRIRAAYEDGRFYVQGDNLAEGEIVARNQITHKILGVVFT